MASAGYQDGDVWHAFYGALDEARSAVAKLGDFFSHHAF